MNATERYAIALHELATQAEPVGMMDPTDTQERERLAVAFIRLIKEECDILSEFDRATRVYGRKNFGIGGSASVRESLASRMLAESLELYLPHVATGFIFTQSKVVPGCSRRLKWVEVTMN